MHQPKQPVHSPSPCSCCWGHMLSWVGSRGACGGRSWKESSPLLPWSQSYPYVWGEWPGRWQVYSTEWGPILHGTPVGRRCMPVFITTIPQQPLELRISICYHLLLTSEVKFSKILQPSVLRMQSVWAKWCLCTQRASTHCIRYKQSCTPAHSPPIESLQNYTVKLVLISVARDDESVCQ